MTAFPCDRTGFAVTSGIRATAGDLYVAIAISTKHRAIMKSTRLLEFAAIGSTTVNIAATAVPTRINGILLPIFVFTLSLKTPKSGSMNNPKTLSKAIMAFAKSTLIWNLLVRMSGMTKSYICQNMHIDMKASPTRNVLL
jgi:hypothetical protein